MNINQALIPNGSNARPGTLLSGFRGVTLHETGNFNYGADARSHMEFKTINGGWSEYVSYHYVVDKSAAYRLVPENEVTWHAGDGEYGTGNNQTISMEICVNPDGDFAQAVRNACEIAVDILKRHGHNKIVDGTKDKANGNVFQHNSWSGKDCPMNIRNFNYWSIVINMLTALMNGTTVPTFPAVTPRDWSGSSSGGSPKDNEPAEIYTSIPTGKTFGMVPAKFKDYNRAPVMNLYAGKIDNYTDICLWTQDFSEDQAWKLVGNGGTYKIATAYNSGKVVSAMGKTAGAKIVLGST